MSLKNGEMRRGSAFWSEGEGNRLVKRWWEAREEGDREEIFRQIFFRFHPPVVHFFRKRGCPHDQSENLAQEVFLRVYKGLAEFRGNTRFETWLYQISTNLFRNMLREQHALKRLGSELSLDAIEEPLPAEAEFWESQEQPPLESLLTEERARILRETIEKLPAQMRRCVLLRVSAGLKYREIAEVMQISIETVKTHLFQARQQLKSELGDYIDL